MERVKNKMAPADGGQAGDVEKAPWEKKLRRLLKRLEYTDDVIKEALEILDRKSIVAFEFMPDGYVVVDEYPNSDNGLVIIRASDAIVVIAQTPDGDYVHCLRI